MTKNHQNCDATCDAIKPFALFLWLRKKTFYAIMELPRHNGKRRYWRQSLYTSNFYQAREGLKHMAIEIDNKIKDKIQTKQALNPFMTRKELVEARDEAIAEYNAEFKANNPSMILSDEVSKGAQTTKTITQKYLISEVVEAMLTRAHTSKETETRKRNRLNELFKASGLSLSDDYSAFHNPTVFHKMNAYILNHDKFQNDNKRRYFALIKELAEYGHNLDPDQFKPNVIQLLTNLPKTSKAERKGHAPYSEEELKNIFDPKHDFFKKNPHAFWVCLIGLFTGARANAALTLQYQDIIQKEGLDCFSFNQNHAIKKLKTSVSIRTIPIHNTLINIGFVDFVNRQKKRLKAKDTDFIIPDCITKGGLYNNKYMVRTLFPFFKEIGAKAKAKDMHDFHSFRKNANLIMEKYQIAGTFINEIIGWDGQDTRERSYSEHTLREIKEQMDKFNYDFLQPHFDEWKKIMAKK